MIPKELEQAIHNAAKIEEVVKDYDVALTRAGVNYKARCPFHAEDTPSFILSPAKGIYKCFGCGKGGGAVNFVMEMERISYPEALKKVGRKYHIEVPDRELSPEEVSAYKERENALEALVKQNITFKNNLSKNEAALKWLTETRGILPDTILKWGLGYAETGFFAGRITYPICNSKGEIMGFTGRRLDENLQPKFKNSAESELYKKGEILFGLHLAKLKIHAAQKCYLVEGQHDVLMMHQAGFENTVAASGTALTPKQIALIKPWTKKLVLILDGDMAGIKAILKHISSLLGEQINLRLVILPEGEDPDSFLRKGEGEKERGRDGEKERGRDGERERGRDGETERLGDGEKGRRGDGAMGRWDDGANETGLKPVYTDAAKEYILTNEIDFIEFKARHFAKEIETDPVQKGELINEITNDIGLINDKTIRQIYIQRCAEIFGIKEGELHRDIARMREKMKSTQEEGKWFAFDFEETKKAIEDAKEVNILSNFEDVIDYHLGDNFNYIGMNCAPLQKGEILKLKKLTKTVIFNELIENIYDRKAKEETPTVLNLKRLISYGLDVRMRTEYTTHTKRSGEGEEDFYDDYTEVSYINFTDWYINHFTEILSPADDLYTSWAVEHIAELLSYLPESSRMLKIGNVQAGFKTAGVKLIVGDFKKILNDFLKKNAKSFEPVAEAVDLSDNPMNLTQDQLTDLNRYQHYFDKNNIHHVSKTGHIARISNFIIIPIIHSNTSTGHFKLFELINEYGLKVNISLDTKDLNDVRRFKCVVEEKGDFVFKGEQYQLDNIKERLYKHTTYSDEIEQLGWQSEGFWAWADGVTTLDGKFTKTDDNGLISVGDKNYLIKPFSNLYAHDKTAYINEKKFLHLTSEATFKEWSYRYLDVFGDNAMICICALVTGIYSDAIFKLVHGELPLINFFGPKGTGKTQQADSLLAFFGEKQPVNNLSKVTIYGLAQTVKAFHNAFCLMDEYKNSLEMRLIETLKSFYNRQGKIQGNWANAGTKTEHIPVNQMILLCGQDLPTLDVALLERCLCLTAYQNEYTDDQKNRYSELKDLEEKGFTHLTDDFIKYRELVIEQFVEHNNQIQTMISEQCKDVSVRLQKNLSTILTAFHILENKFEFPFTFDQVLQFGMSIITNQQKFIESSDDLKNFWSIFATLIEQDKIKEGRNYILHNVAQMRYVGAGEMTIYQKGMNCLFLRWDGLYPLYAEYSRRSNIVALGEKTIQFYLEKTKYFQGRIKAKRFGDKDTKQMWNVQAYCFDYDKMNINLIKSVNIEYDNPDMQPNYSEPEIQEIMSNNREEIELNKAKDELPF